MRKGPRPSAASLHRRACEIARREGWPEPTYAQVYGIVKGIDARLLELAYEGTKAYRQAYDLLHRYEASSPNEVWQADHTRLDVQVLDEGGMATRPWFTVILDDHSRAVAGYLLSFEAPSAIQTALALRQAIWRKEESSWPVCGIPDVFYTDHGSDFVSKHMEQVAADLPMRLVFSTPGQPRGRGKIERFFRTVNEEFLAELPGYCPRGFSRSDPALGLPQLDSAFRAWLLGEYHGRPRGSGREKALPIRRWSAGGFLPRTPDSLEQLDLLLLTVARTRRVRRDGIHFMSRCYLDPVLAAYVGEDVVIRYDPRDIAEIRVFFEGRFLCRAICPEISGYAVSEKEVRNAAARRRRELRARLKESQAAVEELTSLRGFEPGNLQDAPPSPATDAESDAPVGGETPARRPAATKRTIKRYAGE